MSDKDAEIAALKSSLREAQDKAHATELALTHEIKIKCDLVSSLREKTAELDTWRDHCRDWVARAEKAESSLSAVEAERDKWKQRWQDKADAFEVQEQTIAVLHHQKEAVEAERGAERAKRADEDDATAEFLELINSQIEARIRANRAALEAADAREKQVRAALLKARSRLITKDEGLATDGLLLAEIDRAIASKEGGNNG